MNRGTSEEVMKKFHEGTFGRTEIPDNVEVIQNVVYRQGTSKFWTLDIVRPRESPVDGLMPGLILLHGGGWKVVECDKGEYFKECVQYASKGYFCVTADYRLCCEAVFPAAIEDVGCVVRWMKANAGQYGIDAERIGLMGGSSGGHLALMVALTAEKGLFRGDGPYQEYDHGVKAVVDLCGSTDFETAMLPGVSKCRDCFEAFMEGPEEGLAERQRQASPLNYVDGSAPPIFVMHGDEDEAVKIEQSDRLVSALRAAGRDVEYVRLEGVRHAVPFRREEYALKIEAFLGRLLIPESCSG